MAVNVRKNLREFIEVFGYKNEDEFVKEAVEDKILSLKRKTFFEITDKVRNSLIKKGISEREILRAFGD
ncbi:MAG: hypothetical protein QME59_00595 [Candidatus Hydrothermarchaeota archaeon]|nr:hypothetical protein [Candidatus Hydrothermarchaeota archaeon]